MYDIFYLGKPCSHFEKLKGNYPSIRIVTTFAEAKKKCLTKFFWLIPSNVIILDNFNFDYTPDEWSQEYIHVFKNSNNWDGVVLFPRRSSPTAEELESRTFNSQKHVDIIISDPKPYDVFEIDTYDEYLYALETSNTEMFWMGSANITAIIPDVYFSHDNTYDRNQNHVFVHQVGDQESYNGLFLCSKHAPLSKNEIEFRHLINRKEWDIVGSTSKTYDVFEIDSYDEYLHALETSTTEMFWSISRHALVTNTDIFSTSYYPINLYDNKTKYERANNHTYLHKIGNDTYKNYVCLFAKSKKISKKEFITKEIKDIITYDTIVSEPRPYEKVFISYQEPTADENYARILEKFPDCKRIHGVKGIHQAHIAAAKLCSTPMFWIIDGDAQLVDDFNFEYLIHPNFFDHVHVWRSLNPINDLVYGYGGVKLFPRQLTINMDTSEPDMTTSISSKFKAMPDISNITAFNTDPFNTWRSAFRECTKLSSKIIDRQKDDETNKRLDKWCTVGEDRPNGKYAIQGAKAGAVYGARNNGNIEALKKINDFDWLKEQFNGNF